MPCHPALMPILDRKSGRDTRNMNNAFPWIFTAAGKYSFARGIVAGCIVATLTACAAPPPPAGISDPNEAANRGIHAFNVGLDTAVARPLGKVYDTVLPKPVKLGVSNFSGNMDLPGDILNNILQGRDENAVHNFFRFAINSTLGVGGLFDPANSFGLTHRKTDFGETLHVWGAPEGNYVELPVLGPSTERDTVGTVVDKFINPVSILVDGTAATTITGAKVASKIGDRGRYSETVDSVLYDSADGYAQARLLYLQNRRYELGQSATTEDNFLDPYEDPYGQ